MDPERRELFVEGPSDRHFITWLLDESGGGSTGQIIEAQFVDDPSPTGGFRGRLLRLANAGEPLKIPLRVFVDADLDRLLALSHPSKVELSDRRDLEGYFLDEGSFDKLLRVGIGTTKWKAHVLLEQVLLVCEELSVMRVASHQCGWGWGFQELRMSRLVTVSGNRLHFHADRLVARLRQEHGQRDATVVARELARARIALSGHSPVELAHGKDALRVLGCVAKDLGVPPEAAKIALRCSFELARLNTFPALERTLAFLRGE